MNAEQRFVLTIGHSSHPLDTFVALLRRHGVTAVADVRSVPYSRFHAQFRRKSLEEELTARGVRYVFLGRELGARSEDRSCYEGGRVVYGRLARTRLFGKGIERVLQGAKEYRIALMCAEREPLECHRAILIGQHLAERGVAVKHILADGALEPHEETMNRLLDSLKLPRDDLLQSKPELIREALRVQGDRIAYVYEESSRDHDQLVP